VYVIIQIWAIVTILEIVAQVGHKEQDPWVELPQVLVAQLFTRPQNTYVKAMT
jgi:hypothetical protein